MIKGATVDGAMAIQESVSQLRATRMEKHGFPVPTSLQGVSKDRIRKVLTQLSLGSNIDLVDGVFALLDDETESWFARAPTIAKFADGTSTAHLACHIGILQRGNGKLDREGRDYWIKPLRELGGIEPVTLYKGEFLQGHVKPKSPNSAYRLSDQFKAILKAPHEHWLTMLKAWAREDAARERREFQAQLAAASRLLVDTGHSDLISACIEHYAAKFLPGYCVIYTDEGDGDRLSARDRIRLAEAGMDLRLGDAMPDVLLWNRHTNRVWVIEAVTSDGEVDIHKVNQLTDFAKRCGKAGIDFTTAFRTWKDVAARQGTHQNIAVGSYIWIQADAAKHFLVKSFI